MSVLKPAALLRTAIVVAILLTSPALCFGRVAADDPLPPITDLTLQQSTDKAAWTDVYGNLTAGFRMDLDPAMEFYYLNVASLTPSAPLAEGLHPFKLNTTSLPAGYYAYWAAKGVSASAPAGSWEAWMWEIVNGRQPMFYLQVSAGPAYRLLDGLQRDAAHIDEFLRIAGDYPNAVYTFDGIIKYANHTTAPLSVQISFEPFPLLAGLALKQTTDHVAWVNLSGDLTSGFTLALDPAVPYYYLNVASLTGNKPLGTFHAFYFDPNVVPAGYWAYWAAKGVTGDALPGTWEQWMWRIINGTERLAGLVIYPDSYLLYDGLLYEGTIPPQLEYLRVSGDYPLGEYGITAYMFDMIGAEAPSHFKITMTRLAVPKPTAVEIGREGDGAQLTWDAVTQDVNGASTGIKNYEVYRSAAPYFQPGDASSPEPLATVGATEYLDAGVLAGLDGYYYVVRAVNSIGASADSNRTGKFSYALTPGVAAP